MVVRIETFNGDDNEFLKIALEIRQKVFVEELSGDKFLEFDGLDINSVEYLLFFDDLPVATARWRELEEGIKIERVAVLSTFRKKGLGFLLVKKILEDVLLSKQPVFLFAQLKVTSFFELTGFKKVGEMFTESRAQHFKMIFS